MLVGDPIDAPVGGGITAMAGDGNMILSLRDS
jgi:hypothetical protein